MMGMMTTVGRGACGYSVFSSWSAGVEGLRLHAQGGRPLGGLRAGCVSGHCVVGGGGEDELVSTAKVKFENWLCWRA